MAGWNRWVTYASLFLLAVLVRLACFTGIICSDDLGYSYFAQLISGGTYLLNHSHIGPRVGVTAPVGIVYRLFGIGEFTTILVPLATSAAAVPLLVEIGRRLFTPRAALLAGVLLLSFPTQVRYATILVPEPIMEFWLLVAALVYISALSDDRPLRAVLAGCCFGLAYLAKEVALFAGAAFFLDALLFRRWKLAVAVASGMMAVGVAEVVYYAVALGDPLHRAHVIAHTQAGYFSGQLGELKSASRLLRYYPKQMLLPNVDFGLHSVVALLVVGLGVYWLPKRAIWMSMLWAALPMLYLNFGSASLTTYLPVATAPRYIGLVYAPLFLLAGAVMDSLIQKDQPLSSLCWAAVVLVISSGLVSAYSTRAEGYFTAEVASLRAIQRSGHAIDVFEGPRARRWQLTMRLLAGPGENLSRRSGACLVVAPDALGLPSTLSTSAECRRASAGNRPALVYPF